MRYLLIIILCLIPIIGNTTETIKISELGTAASGDATDDDYFVMVDDPGGAPVTKKITGQNLFGALPRLGVTSCGTGVVYSTADVFSCETTLSGLTYGSFAASLPLCADDAGNATTCTTQPMKGSIPTTSDADGMSQAEMTAAGMYGQFYFATGAGTFNLPAAAAGMNICVYSTTAAAVVINPDDADDITLNGAIQADGATITSASGAGDFICLIAADATHWYTLGRSGTWTSP